MDRGTNETPGSESKGGRQKFHLEPPYETNMSSSGPDLRLEHGVSNTYCRGIESVYRAKERAV
jgi:hypothetical protein